MSILKKHIAISFLFLWILIQGIGSINVLQLSFHKKIEQQKKVNYYVTISKSDWKNCQKINDDECRINGKMFDVKSIEYKTNEVVLLGHYDKKENEILNQQHDFEKKKQAQKQSSSFVFLFYEKIETLLFYQPKKFIAKKENRFDESVLINNLEEDFLPPKDFYRFTLEVKPTPNPSKGGEC